MYLSLIPPSFTLLSNGGCNKRKEERNVVYKIFFNAPSSIEGLTDSTGVIGFPPVNTVHVLAHFGNEKKIHLLTSKLRFQVMSNGNLHRNVVESKVQYLSLKCSGV